jgi:hypothetical protein
MRTVSLSIAVSILLAAAAKDTAAQAQAPTCHGTQQPKEIAEFIFGRDIGNRIGVDEAAWTRFVARELTPRFPDGLTISDATGQWRDRDSGAIIREPSKHVEIVLPGGDDDKTRLDAAVAAYKRQFRQHTVVLIVRPACVSF